MKKTSRTRKLTAWLLTFAMLLTLAPGFALGVSAADVGYTITVSPSENGTVTADKSEADIGETVTLTVAPGEIYKLESLVVNENDVTDQVVDNQYTFKMPAEAVTVKASFKELPFKGFMLDENRFVLPFGTEITETLLRELVGEMILLYGDNREVEIRTSEYSFPVINHEEKIATIQYQNGVAYIKWAFGYKVIVDEAIEHGDIMPVMAAEGDEVELTVVADEGYELESITVMYGETPIPVDDYNCFIMPAGEVTVTATFKVAIERYNVWIGNEQFTEETLTIEGDEGKATYNPDTNTLTLDNFTYTDAKLWASGIFSGVPLNIVLKGENSIDVASHPEFPEEGGVGIFTSCSVAISGPGSLYINADFIGIFSEEDIMFDGAEITVNSYVDCIYALGNIVIKDATLSLDATEGDDGIYADGDVAITDSDIEAEVKDDGVDAVGDLLIKGSNIEIVAEDDGLSANGSVYVESGNITIESFGDDGIDSEIGIIITGGNIKMTVDDNGFTAKEDIEIYGGSIDIESGDKAVYTGEGYDIIVKGVTIKKPTGAKIGEVGGTVSENPDIVLVGILNPDGTFAKNVVIGKKTVSGGGGGLSAGGSSSAKPQTPKPETPVAPTVPQTPATPDAPGTDTAPSTPVFADVHTASHWAKADVDYVSEKGLMNGTSATTFNPDGKVTRAMLVTVLYRNEGEPATNRSIPFSDVDLGAYYGNAVIWAKQNGIVNGINENDFAPDAYITREQIATIMFRYAQYKGMEAMTLEENLHFADAGEISEYAISAMNWAVGKGLMKGKTESTVNPKDNTTRAEMAAILHRFIEATK